MNGDYKFAMQLLAEQMAQDRFDKDFSDLPEKLQDAVFRDAEREYVERAADRADYMRKAEREGKI